MRVSAIAAVATNGVIGNGGRLPWHLPEDLKYFKETTVGRPVILGRKTYESIGRLLPGRPHWILSRNSEFEVSGARVVRDLAQALTEIRAEYPNEQECFILGGGEIYAEAIRQGILDRLYLTEVAHDFEGDAFFPEWDRAKFVEISSRPGIPRVARQMVTQGSSVPESDLHYRFVVYERR